ncbi:MAG: hypothetical protein Q9187_002230 [Circinaria calcarea]
MYLALLSICLAALVTAFLSWRRRRSPAPKPKGKIPISVNYHFTRKCNYSCGFCFHTETTSYIAPLAQAKRGLALLQQAGMKKINFAGGEPFLYPKFLGALARYCKDDLGLESVSVVTNGSKVTQAQLADFGRYIDIMAVSCDSFDEATNVAIGRGTGAHLDRFRVLAALCRTHGIRFKVNTVVNRLNVAEDMTAPIRNVAPFRWKCFQVLLVAGENDSSATKRDATRFAITDAEFQRFCDRHAHLECFVPESNRVMRSSYLILDEYMRFLNKGTGEPTGSILEVGVERALEGVLWDEESFEVRGGVYDWTREGKKEARKDQALDW